MTDFPRSVLNSTALLFVVMSIAAHTVFGQTKPKAGTAASAAGSVTQVDDLRLKQIMRPKSGKPLLVNFWATWCDPCREEFPELVKIDGDYKGKIDFITVSLDFPEQKDTAVPKFLTEMKAEMPTYLLVSQDESAIISAIAKDWTGGLPFTILYNGKGGIAYFRQGKVKPELLRTEIDKLVETTAAPVGR